MLSKKDFYDRFIIQLDNIKSNYNLRSTHDGLIHFFGQYVLRLDPDDVATRIVTDRSTEAVDALLLDPKTSTFYFVAASKPDKFEKTAHHFEEKIIRGTLNGMNFLLDGNYKGNITPTLENLVDEYHDRIKTGEYTTRLLFLGLRADPNSDKYITYFTSQRKAIEVELYNFNWFYNFYVNNYLLLKKDAPEKITFKVLSKILHKDVPHKSRVFTCKGVNLAEIYKKHKESIFEQNVRYSLGIRSRSINRQILSTASDNNDAMEFWYFNNGITIICKEIIDLPVDKAIVLKHAQIINGAQTTYALHQAFLDGHLKDEVEVLVKVIESTDKTFIDNVTLYTNSQNPIRLRDLCSNDQIQTEIQTTLLSTYKYFYERKRGELESNYRTASAKEKILGPNFAERIINNENAAQAFLAFYQNSPAQAKSEKGRIFLKDDLGFYEIIFNKKYILLAEKLLLCWKLLKYIENYKQNYSKTYRKTVKSGIKKRKKVFRYDFLLHSEYFILNLFKDFLKNRGFDFNKRRDHIEEIISKIDSGDPELKNDYELIKDHLEKYIRKLRKDPDYYHNKFFKNEQSIVQIRREFRKTFRFVELIK